MALGHSFAPASAHPSGIPSLPPHASRGDACVARAVRFLRIAVGAACVARAVRFLRIAVGAMPASPAPCTSPALQ